MEENDELVLGSESYFKLIDGSRSVLLSAHVEYLLSGKDSMSVNEAEMLTSLQNQLSLQGIVQQNEEKTNNVLIVHISHGTLTSEIHLACDLAQDDDALSTLAKHMNKYSTSHKVVLWDCGSVGRWNAAESYVYMDDLTRALKKIQNALPLSLVGWIAPSDLFLKQTSTVEGNDGVLIWGYLALKHLVHDNGFVVLPRSLASVAEFRPQLMALLKFLPYHDALSLTKVVSHVTQRILAPHCTRILNTRKYVPHSYLFNTHYIHHGSLNYF